MDTFQYFFMVVLTIVSARWPRGKRHPLPPLLQMRCNLNWSSVRMNTTPSCDWVSFSSGPGRAGPGAWKTAVKFQATWHEPCLASLAFVEKRRRILNGLAWGLLGTVSRLPKIQETLAWFLNRLPFPSPFLSPFPPFFGAGFPSIFRLFSGFLKKSSS